MPPKGRPRKASSKSSVDTSGTSNPTHTDGPNAVNNMDHSHVQSSSDLPPPREHKKLKHRTYPPLQRAPWHLFNYTFVAIMFLAAAYYFYHTLMAALGGRWSLGLGLGSRPHPQTHTGGWWGGSGTGSSQRAPPNQNDLVQSRIDALAEALGLRSEDLSSAIAGAVKEHVPHASLSSIAAQETGKAARVLAGDEDALNQPGIVGSVAEGIGKVVGLDDPPEGSV